MNNQQEYQSAFNAMLDTWRNIFAREVESALLGGALSVARPKTRERVLNGLRGKGEKRSPEAIRATTNKLLAAIKTAPGSRIEYLSKQLDIPTKDLALPVKKLIAAKSVKTKGQKRATAYYPASRGAQ